MKKIHTYIESVDIGDTVLCDCCNEEYTRDNPASGGFLFGSYAYCPKCADKSLERIKQYHEEEYIKDYCPAGMSYHDWVMRLRGGDNTIKVITKGPE